MMKQILQRTSKSGMFDDWMICQTDKDVLNIVALFHSNDLIFKLCLMTERFFFQNVFEYFTCLTHLQSHFLKTIKKLKKSN